MRLTHNSCQNVKRVSNRDVWVETTIEVKLLVGSTNFQVQFSPLQVLQRRRTFYVLNQQLKETRCDCIKWEAKTQVLLEIFGSVK